EGTTLDVTGAELEGAAGPGQVDVLDGMAEVAGDALARELLLELVVARQEDGGSMAPHAIDADRLLVRRRRHRRLQPREVRRDGGRPAVPRFGPELGIHVGAGH